VEEKAATDSANLPQLLIMLWSMARTFDPTGPGELYEADPGISLLAGNEFTDLDDGRFAAKESA